MTQTNTAAVRDAAQALDDARADVSALLRLVGDAAASQTLSLDPEALARVMVLAEARLDIIAAQADVLVRSIGAALPMSPPPVTLNDQEAAP